jgi:hypothetical protein
MSNSTHFVNYMFYSASRGRPVSERLIYGVDDQISIPDTCRMFLFSAESQTCPWAHQGIHRLRGGADHCLHPVRGGISPMLHRFTTSWRGAWLRKLYLFIKHEAPRDVIYSILVFVFFVPCIVIQLCNANQQKALFKLLFQFNLLVFYMFRTSYVHHFYLKLN